MANIRYSTNDPKYDIEVIINDGGTVTGAQLVNAATGVAIPSEEPVMMFRAKDTHALSVILYYASRLSNKLHTAAVLERVSHFAAFVKNYPERMKEPDTQ